MADKKYRFVGDGAGVPGLPNEISEAEAVALNTADLLAAALENGSYVLVTGKTPAAAKHEQVDGGSNG